MYLTARLIGVFTYCIALCSTCLLLLQTKNTKKIKWILLVYLIALTAMGYLYVPDTSADLFRLLRSSELFASRPFGDLLYYLSKTNTPGATIYFYFVGLLHNPHILPALSAFIDFSLLFSIMVSEVKRTPTKGTYVALALFIFMSSSCLMDSISGIRNMMSYCIIAWCLYREFALKKNFLAHLPLYLIAASLHAMGQVLLIYRVFLFCFEKTSFLGRIFKFIISIALLLLIIVYAQKFLSGILEKGNGYYTSNQEGTKEAYIWAIIVSAFKWLVAIYEVKILFGIRKWIKEHNPSDPLFNMTRLLLPLIIIAPILSIFIPIFFGRIMMFVSIFLIPITIMLFKSLPTSKSVKSVAIKLLFLSLITLGISCTRGYLCSLKFFVS